MHLPDAHASRPRTIPVRRKEMFELVEALAEKPVDALFIDIEIQQILIQAEIGSRKARRFHEAEPFLRILIPYDILGLHTQFHRLIPSPHRTGSHECVAGIHR